MSQDLLDILIQISRALYGEREEEVDRKKRWEDNIQDCTALVLSEHVIVRRQDVTRPEGVFTHFCCQIVVP